MPRVPPPCFRKKLLGSHIPFASRMSYVQTAIKLHAKPPLDPPPPADTRDGAALARCVVFGVHARTRNERRKKGNCLKVPRETEKTKNRWKGPASNEIRRFPSGSSERRGMYQTSTLREGDLSGSIYSCTGVRSRMFHAEGRAEFHRYHDLSFDVAGTILVQLHSNSSR